MSAFFSVRLPLSQGSRGRAAPLAASSCTSCVPTVTISGASPPATAVVIFSTAFPLRGWELTRTCG